MHCGARSSALTRGARCLAKQASGKKAKREAGAKEQASKESSRALQQLEHNPVSKERALPEDQEHAASMAKAHSRHAMAAHRAVQRDLQHKLDLKNAAIAALPEPLRQAAAEPDERFFPAKRKLPTHSPPNPEFSASRRRRAEEAFERKGSSGGAKRKRSKRVG